MYLRRTGFSSYTGQSADPRKNVPWQSGCCFWFTSQEGILYKDGIMQLFSAPLYLYFLLLFSHSVMSDSLLPHGLQHASLPCLSPSPEVCSNSCLLSWWCHPTISSSVAHFSCPQSFPASRSFPVSRLFPSDSQSIRASASVSVLPMNIQGWFPLGLTSLISCCPLGLSRVFSITTVWMHQFFGTQPSLWSISHIDSHMTIGKTIALTTWTFVIESWFEQVFML